MTTLDLRYYDTDTNKWEAPLANNSDLLTLSQNLSAHVTDGEKHLNPGDHARIGKIFEQNLERFLGDVNTLTTPGVYAIGDQATNIPGYQGTGGYGVLTVTTSSDVVIQEYTEYNSTGTFYRTTYSSLQGVWLAWVRCATDFDLHYHVSQTAMNGTKPHGIGTAAAQDYEIGLWNPVLTFNNMPSPDMVINPQLTWGEYTRIGNMVTIDGVVGISSRGSEMPGTLTVNGLPFFSRRPYNAIHGRYENMSSVYERSPSPLVIGNFIRLDQFTTGGLSLTNYTILTDASMLFFNGIYYID